jgi:hypothetical protein
MTQESPTNFANEHVLEHLEDEIKSLEGVTRWKRPVFIVVLVLVVAAAVAGMTWFVMSPPPITSGHAAYVGGSGMSIEVVEPKGATLAAPPARFAWESVTGRLQYVVRVYVKGSSNPVLERRTTGTSLELTADDQALMPRGNSFVWKVVAQGQNGATIGEGEATFKVR